MDALASIVRYPRRIFQSFATANCLGLPIREIVDFDVDLDSSKLEESSVHYP